MWDVGIGCRYYNFENTMMNSSYLLIIVTLLTKYLSPGQL